MPYISAFFLIPSTIILISNLLIIIYEGFSKPSFYFESSILDTGFLTAFFLSHLAGWLSIVFSVPFRDQGEITLIGKGVIAGLITLPFAFTHFFLDGRTTSAVVLLCGWFGLLIRVLPDLPRSWRRRAPRTGLIVAALILPVLINPLVWKSTRLLPVPEAAWGVYYPDYDREQGKEFIEHYQRHEEQFNKEPKLIISKAGLFMINVLGRPLSNTFTHCGPDGSLNVFSSNSEQDCGEVSNDNSWSLLEIEFYESGSLRCMNCRNFGKPKHWVRIDQLPEGYQLPFVNL